MKHVFKVPRYLLPIAPIRNEWPVIACDQYSQNPSYWNNLYNKLSTSVSSLNHIFPEALYSSVIDWEIKLNEFYRDSVEQLYNGYLEEHQGGVILVRRVTKSGDRLGVLLLIDLEDYSYDINSNSLLRASEFTDLNRLVKRKDLRKASAIELSHTLVFFDDQKDKLLKYYRNRFDEFKTIYDIVLNNEGGRLSAISIEDKEEVLNYFDSLVKRDQTTFFVGDGNHSLASAKELWEEIKEGLEVNEIDTHPLRFHLVELINIHDSAINFHPIHRAIYPVKKQFVNSFLKNKLGNKKLQVHFNGDEYPLYLTEDVIENYNFIDKSLIEYAKKNNIKYDFIHDEEVAKKLSDDLNDCLVVIMPNLSKSDFFRSISLHKILPQKSFSIGYANEKKYYFEARSLK